MTLLDLCRLMKKHIALIVIVTVVCAALGAGYVLLSKQSMYKATASVVGNSQSTSVLGFAMAEGNKLLGVDGEYTVEAEVEKGMQIVNVTVTGPVESECIAKANEIAENTNAQAIEMFKNFENPYNGTVQKVEEADEHKAGGGKKYILVAVLAGLFSAIIIVVIIDLRRRPVKSLEGMQEAVELPVLEKLPAQNGERLLANVRFASNKDDVANICVIPLSNASPAAEVCDLLRAAYQAEASKAQGAEFAAEACKPLSEGMEGAYRARSADAVLVAARQWSDSLTDLETTVAELKLADAKLVGLVYAPEK